MPDGKNTIWVDSTFSSLSDATRDTYTDIRFAEAENIGEYTIPVVFSAVEPQDYFVDTYVDFSLNTSVSGYEQIPVACFTYTVPTISGVITSLVEYYNKTTTMSGTNSTDVIYSTGYNTVSGYLTKKVCFTGGREFLETTNILNSFNYYQSISGFGDTWVNYYNNNLTDVIYPYIVESSFGNVNNFTDGAISDYVDIFFAGWVNFPFNVDVYSTIENTYYFDTESTVISGGLYNNDLEIYACGQQIKYMPNDVYCSLVDLVGIYSDLTTISGRVTNINNDVYSADTVLSGIRMDIDLYSLKITNFSLDIGGYTSASGLVSVDIEDDVCPVSISGSYMMLDGQVINITYVPISDGYRLIYDPIDDFESINGSTMLTVHAENECGDQLEQNYYLTFGYLVAYDNLYSQNNVIDFGYDNSVMVRVTAEDYATCPNNSTYAWEFESKPLFNRNLGASIVCNSLDASLANIPASIYPQSPTAYIYGKEFRVVVRAKDFSGNEMEPFVLTYKIEDKPI